MAIQLIEDDIFAFQTHQSYLRLRGIIQTQADRTFLHTLWCTFYIKNDPFSQAPSFRFTYKTVLMI